MEKPKVKRERTEKEKLAFERMQNGRKLKALREEKRQQDRKTQRKSYRKKSEISNQL